MGCFSCFQRYFVPTAILLPIFFFQNFFFRNFFQDKDLASQKTSARIFQIIFSRNFFCNFFTGQGLPLPKKPTKIFSEILEG